MNRFSHSARASAAAKPRVKATPADPTRAKATPARAAKPAAPRKTARGLKTRAALLAAGEELFGVKGFEATSIVDLTQASGIALGTFYIHFPDKKALFVELVDSLGQRLRRHIAARVGGSTDRVDMERRGLEAFVDFVVTHRNLYRVVRQADFVDQECFRRYYRNMAAAYARGLAAASARGEIRQADPEILAYCLMGIADFLGMRWVLWEKRPRREVLADAMAFVEAGLAPPRKR